MISARFEIPSAFLEVDDDDDGRSIEVLILLPNKDESISHTLSEYVEAFVPILFLIIISKY